MQTLTGIEIKKGLEVVKPFVGNLRKKDYARPILKRALVTESHIIATDSHRLIRLKHNETPEARYLHHYKTENDALDVKSYPNTDRLIPNTFDAKHTFKVNIAEWLEAHNLALVAAKEHENRTTILEEFRISVDAVQEEVNTKGKKVKVPLFNQIGFSYSLDTDTKVEKVAYNCEYMLDMVKAFKKLKVKEVTCYFYGPMRPMLFQDENELCQVLILPVRSF